jgi:hypothetical protein
MTKEAGYADQRYYYAVALRFVPGSDAKDLWNSITGVEEGRLPDVQGTCSVEHRTILSPRPYGRELPERQSRATDGRFIYDVSAISNTIHGRFYLTLAVPFSELGIDIARQLRNAGLLRQAEFIRPNLQKVLEQVEKGNHAVGGLNISRIEVGLTGFPEVTGFSLAGDQILGTPLYKTLMTEISRQEAAGITLKRCVVKVLTNNGAHLSIWCDSFGNYRLWFQRNAKNASVFCDFLAQISTIDAEISIATIPFFRAREES